MAQRARTLGINLSGPELCMHVALSGRHQSLLLRQPLCRRARFSECNQQHLDQHLRAEQYLPPDLLRKRHHPEPD